MLMMLPTPRYSRARMNMPITTMKILAIFLRAKPNYEAAYSA